MAVAKPIKQVLGNLKEMTSTDVIPAANLALAALKANDLSDLASAKTARVNLGQDKRTTVGNAAYSILLTDKEVVTSATFTTARIWTLPDASTVNAGYEIIVADEFQTVTSANTLTVAVQSGQKLNGVTNGTEVLAAAGSWRRLISDGTSNWIFDAGIVRLAQTQTLTNKTISGSANTLTNIGTSSIVNAAITNAKMANIAANSIRGNNTGSAAVGAEFIMKFVAEQTIGTTVTWSGTAPTGETKLYKWSQNEMLRQVTVWVHLIYTGGGVSNSQVTIPLPTDMPDPVIPTGLTGANVYLYIGSGYITTAISTQNTALYQAAYIRRNAADNGFNIIINYAGTIAAKYATATLIYNY